MVKSMIWLSLATALLVAVACAGTAGESTPTVATKEPTPIAAPTATSTRVPTATTSEQLISIIGKVMDVSLSARIIMLTESVQGFNTVAMTEETEILASSGCKAALQDVQKGMTIQASGKPGTSGAILANKVLIMQASPT